MIFRREKRREPEIDTDRVIDVASQKAAELKEALAAFVAGLDSSSPTNGSVPIDPRRTDDRER